MLSLGKLGGQCSYSYRSFSWLHWRGVGVGLRAFFQAECLPFCKLSRPGDTCGKNFLSLAYRKSIPFFLELGQSPPLGSLCQTLVLESSTVFSPSVDELGASQLVGRLYREMQQLPLHLHMHIHAAFVYMFMCVYVYICMYMYTYMKGRGWHWCPSLFVYMFMICAHMYVHMYMYEGLALVSFSIVHHVIFGSRVFIEPGPRLSSTSWPVRPGVFLSLSLWCWDHRPTLLHLAF